MGKRKKRKVMLGMLQARATERSRGLGHSLAPWFIDDRSKSQSSRSQCTLCGGPVFASIHQKYKWPLIEGVTLAGVCNKALQPVAPAPSAPVPNPHHTYQLPERRV